MSEETYAPHRSEDGGFAPVPLLATGYNFQELEMENRRIETDLTTDRGQAEALGRMAEKFAVDQRFIEGRNEPALPEGTKLANIADAQGRIVEAPVSIADKAGALDDLPAPEARVPAPPETMPEGGSTAPAASEPPVIPQGAAEGEPTQTGEDAVAGEQTEEAAVDTGDAPKDAPKRRSSTTAK